MYRLGLPVPPAFTLAAPLCGDYHQNKVTKKEWMDEVRTAVGKIESKTGNKFGGELGASRPLMFSVRSSMTKDMPEDMLRTILNLGINRSILDALAQQTSSGRWVLQTYIKFLKSFGTQVMNVDPAKFEKVLETMRNGDWKDEDPSGRESNALLKALGEGDGRAGGGDSTDR